MLVIESKSQAEMKNKNDIFTIVATQPAEEKVLRSCEELGHKA